jgi:hypothetical protein
LYAKRADSARFLFVLSRLLFAGVMATKIAYATSPK